MNDQYVERVIDLTDPARNRILNMTLDEARVRLASRVPETVAAIDGSFALVARDGRRVILARSLDRPLRYFLAKQAAGPALVVSDRIDAIHAFLRSEDLDGQFHPSYTRMVPAHHVVEIELSGCPDPSPSYTRWFTPERNTLAPDPAAIGPRYVAALVDEVAKWIRAVPEREPIGVCFSGGIDSGAVFLAAHHVLRSSGGNLGRLKAFTLSIGGGDDLAQARAFLAPLGMGLFLEGIEASPDAIDPFEAVRIVEDYKPLDVASATMAIALCRGIRERYPEWRFLLDGDGGDENLKDYPIEENPELTIRSVVNNPLLYQEGWGVGKMKHSLTYSGGQSRSYSRTYAPLRRFGFEGFSPFTRPAVVAVAEAIPFAEMAGGDTEKLYALKGDVVRRGVASVIGVAMPVFPKRRFQHGALAADEAGRIAFGEARYREHFLSLYA